MYEGHIISSEFGISLNWKEKATAEDILDRLRDASFLLSVIPFLKGIGLRNSISFGEPKLYVIQLRLGVCVLCTREKRKQTKKRSKEAKKKGKIFNQIAAERKHNAVSFQGSQGSAGCVHLNCSFKKWKQN